MNKKTKIAFTLIELLVVIAIIGILSGLIVVTMNGVTSKANIAKSQVFSNSLRNALMANLVAEYKLDGNASDGWGGINGTWYGSGGGTNTSANYRPAGECISGQCLNFDGTDDYIGCGTNPSLNITNNLSIEAWVKTTAGYKPIAGTWYYLNTGDTQGYRLDIHTDGYARLVIYGEGTYLFTSTKKVNDGAWHHIAATFNPSNYVKLYVDGAMEQWTSGVPASITSSTHGFNIGYYYSNGDSFFVGSIDNVRVFNSTIPTSQVEQSYYSELNNLLISKNITKKEYLSKINDI